MKALLAAVLLFASPAAFAASVSIEGLVGLLIWLVVVGLIFWLAWWFIGFVGLPEPFAKVAHVLVGLIAFIILIYLLLGILGGPLPTLHLR